MILPHIDIRGGEEIDVEEEEEEGEKKKFVLSGAKCQREGWDDNNPDITTVQLHIYIVGVRVVHVADEYTFKRQRGYITKNEKGGKE